MRVLGCSCTGSAAFFALLRGEEYFDDPLTRIDFANVLDRGERLIELRARVRVELERIKPDAVALVGSIARNLSYNTAAERATIETIVRLVAQELSIHCGRLSPPTVAARLGVSRTGKFEVNVRRFFAEEHPPYWAERCKAAAVAIAWQRA